MQNYTKLILIRGLPGSGKSTVSNLMVSTTGLNFQYEADMYFMNNGVYQFDWTKLNEAHTWCLESVRDRLINDTNRSFTDRRQSIDTRIIVSNVFAIQKHVDPYIALANVFGVKLIIIDLYDGGLTDEELEKRCLHNVPLSSIQKMRAQYEHKLKRV